MRSSRRIEYAGGMFSGDESSEQRHARLMEERAEFYRKNPAKKASTPAKRTSTASVPAKAPAKAPVPPSSNSLKLATAKARAKTRMLEIELGL